MSDSFWSAAMLRRFSTAQRPSFNEEAFVVRHSSLTRRRQISEVRDSTFDFRFWISIQGRDVALKLYGVEIGEPRRFFTHEAQMLLQ
jgi:hypothetical protein